MIFDDIVMCYGIVALSHLFIQISFAHMELFKNTKIDDSLDFSKTGVAVVIPCYNEDPILFRKCVVSALNIKSDKFKKYGVFAIDDGSSNTEAYDKASEIIDDRFHIQRLKKNVGKRKAQLSAFNIIENSEYDVIITLDSDTILDSKAVDKLVSKILSDRNIGAVTGFAAVIHRERNLLTRLISSRYWVAFNLERAAQSLFGSVLCCTGVISAYRNDVVQEVKHKYTSQFFRGIECTYGDDRNLTNLVLEKGFKVVYEHEAIGYTDVPKNMKQYLKQQLRWNRSFYRELYVTAKIVSKFQRRYPLYMFYDLLIQTIMPIALILSVVYMAYRSIYLSPLYVMAFLGTLIGIGALRSVYAYSLTRDKNFVFFPLYAFIHLFLLTPLRVYALFSLTSKGWGTR